ncbi:MAG: amidohydrolase family protein [Thermodesulfobacteriota bacterium]
MTRIIDLRLDFPLSANDIAEMVKYFVLSEDKSGIANYIRIFGPQWEASLGFGFEELEKKAAALPSEELDKMLKKIAGRMVVTPEQFKGQLDKAGIEWGLIEADDIQKTAKLVSKLPEKLKGIALFNPFTGTRGIKEVEQAVKEMDFAAIYASPYKWGIKADDPRFFPVYAKAVELNVPVFIYTAMNYRTDLPMDIGRPLYLDKVAMSFPDLKIIASCGGWPWVPELIGVARRHGNIYIDTSSHRPKYLGMSGSGFEMLMQFGNTLLQDRIVFASGAGDLGLSIEQIVQEVKELPLKDKVKEKWLYHNAAALFPK